MGLFARTIDRFEKAFGPGPRCHPFGEATPETKGKIFGFITPWIRWSIIRPLLALAYLYFYPHQYKTYFSLLIPPAAVLSSFYLREKGEPILFLQARPTFFLPTY
jgi:hypothetical protein